MDIGICTTDFKAMPLQSLFNCIRGMGFSHVQLSFADIAEFDFMPTGQHEFPDCSNVSASLLDSIADCSRQLSLPIIAVNGTFNMAHPDKAVRDEGVRRFASFADAVSHIGVKCITLCSGTRNSEHLWSYHGENGCDSAWRDMFDTFEKVLPIAEKHKITLAVETEASNIINTAEKARKLMDTLSSPYVKMILDAANLFQKGTAHKENVEKTMTEAFEILGKDIVIAHGKDIREGDGIDFCSAGEGIVDFPLFFRLLKKYGCNFGMTLHSIYDTAKMPSAIEFIRGCAV